MYPSYGVVFFAVFRSSCSVGHRGKFGHEFMEFEFRGDGKLRYANNSNYKKDSMIRKEGEGLLGCRTGPVNSSTAVQAREMTPDLTKSRPALLLTSSSPSLFLFLFFPDSDSVQVGDRGSEADHQRQ